MEGELKMTYSEPPEDQIKPTEQNVFKDDSLETNITSGLDENIAGLLSYIVIVGIVFIFIEKENNFIRFHAFQSIFTFISLVSLLIALSIIPFIGWIIATLLSPVTLILVVFLMYQAYSGERYKLPFIGNFAEKYAVIE